MLTRNRRLLSFSALYFAQGTILSDFLTFKLRYLVIRLFGKHSAW